MLDATPMLGPALACGAGPRGVRKECPSPVSSFMLPARAYGSLDACHPSHSRDRHINDQRPYWTLFPQPINPPRIFPNPPLLVLHPISTRVPLLEVTHPVSQPLPYLPAVPKLVGTFVHPMLHEMAQLIKHHPKESKEYAEETASHGLCGLSLP